MIDTLKNDAAGKLVLRCSVGILMLFHGVAKLMHPDTLDFIRGLLSFYGLPEFIALGLFAGEILAPLMLVFGVFSRVGGLMIVVNMLFAIGLAHTGDFFSLSEHGGWSLELQGFYLFGGLAVLLLGSGRIAFRPD